ncbi:MAG: hypothetical protein KGD57_05145 [Candidatus Lokiarchaeota archaeon]|nr:hypothetical protein [Candidatus Lokiarchaeota archaeon]
MFCHNCGDRLDDSAIYCEKCGIKVRKEDATNYFSHSDAMSRYYNLEYELDEIKDQISNLSSKEAYLQRLISNSKIKSNQLQQIRWVMQAEKKDYDDLLKVSFSSIKARLKGHIDEEKRKEEAEYLEALANFKYVQKEFKELENEINNKEAEIDHLHKLKSKIPEIENEMDNLLTQLTISKTTYRLDDLELKNKEIKKELNTIKKAEEQFEQANNLLKKAENSLGNALEKLGSAQGLGTWDTFFGGGFFVDSMKHRRLNSARSDINYAQTFIRQAKDMVDVVEEIYIDFEAPNMFTDIFFDNFFFDMFGNAKISRTRQRVQKAFNQITMNRKNIVGRLENWEQKRINLVRKINNIRKNVREERELLL